MALTEEQKLRMEENRKKALEKRKQNQNISVSNSGQNQSNFRQNQKNIQVQNSPSSGQNQKGNFGQNQRNFGQNQGNPVEIFNSPNRQKIIGKCHLVSRDRFCIDIKYQNEVISQFKKAKTGLYNAKDRIWTFKISEHDSLLAQLRPLQKINVHIEALPRWILETFKPKVHPNISIGKKCRVQKCPKTSKNVLKCPKMSRNSHKRPKTKRSETN